MRLTDEEIADVSARVADGKCHKCAGTGNEHPWRMCSACEGTGVFALSTETMLGVLAELRERRAADLSADECAALEYLRFFAEELHERAAYVTGPEREHAHTCDVAIKALDKLLGGSR